jgi:hypothetical protein
MSATTRKIRFTVYPFAFQRARSSKKRAALSQIIARPLQPRSQRDNANKQI